MHAIHYKDAVAISGAVKYQCCPKHIALLTVHVVLLIANMAYIIYCTVHAETCAEWRIGFRCVTKGESLLPCYGTAKIRKVS